MNPVAQVREFTHNDEPLYKSVMTFCPGCQQAHQFRIEVYDESFAGDTWEWDGNLESPTFSPSLLCYSSVHICAEEDPEPEVCEDPDNCPEKGHLILNEDWRDTETRVLGHVAPHKADPAWGNCHSFLKNGRWEFLSDSAHKLAGQTVDMVPLPDWLVKQ